MKNLFIFKILFLISSLGLFAWEDFEDRTLSPYFFIKSENPEIDQLPLKSTGVSVKISGVIADVTVKQVYKNEGKRPIEAIYVFPGSTKAAVYGMKMKISERIIVARIKEIEEARQIYEKARKEGRTASLLQQQRPNVFQMNVTNIMPGDLIEVELKYTELLLPEERIYEFVYPTVVGSRYSNQKEENAPPSEKWIKSPYFYEKEKPSYEFFIDVKISSPVPIYEVSCPSHKVNVNYLNPEKVKIDLDEEEKFLGNRDFILRYKLSGKKIEEGILLYENGKEKFFLLNLQPPERIKNSQIPKREYIFIVDVSGSMYGYPLEISKRVIKGILGNLKENDKFNVLLFSGSSQVLSEKSLNAIEENIKMAISLIDSQSGGGGTELLPALKRALSLPRDEKLSTTIIILTDGYVAVEKEAFEIIRKNLNNANLFPFGIGTSVNRYIIEGMARAGMADSFIVTNFQKAEEAVQKFQEVVSFPVLTDIEIEFNGFDVYDVEPVSIPDLFLEKPILVFGKYKGSPEGVIEIKGRTGEGIYKKSINVYEEKPSKSNSALPYLWARERIAILSDYSSFSEKEVKEEIINLGLSYNLLTQYTSFIAEDSKKRNQGGDIEEVNQPLPLPEGVSNYAVGNSFFNNVASKPCMEMAVEPKDNSFFEEKQKISIEKVKIRILSLKVSEKKDEENIKKIFLKNLKNFEGCLKDGKRGKISFKMIIGKDGKMESIKILNLKVEKEFHKCIIEKMGTINFYNLNLERTLEIEMEMEIYV